jgi:hypothetical protein
VALWFAAQTPSGASTICDPGIGMPRKASMLLCGQGTTTPGALQLMKDKTVNVDSDSPRAAS